MITPAIKGFSGPYRFLSNFFIEPDGSFVEYEFQRAKCSEFHERAKFDTLFDKRILTPKQAKVLGSAVHLREDWLTVRVDIMTFYVMKKFKDHKDLWWMLQQTGDAWLEEANTWGDTFWGTCRGRGDNVLGTILMQVRADLG